MVIPSRRVAAALGAIATLIGCGQPSDSTDTPQQRGTQQRGTPRDLETVRDVKKRYGDEILRRYNAVGHGITTARKLGRLPVPEDEVYVISVYLLSSSDKPKTLQQIGGVPLKFRVTGQFEAL